MSELVLGWQGPPEVEDGRAQHEDNGEECGRSYAHEKWDGGIQGDNGMSRLG